MDLWASLAKLAYPDQCALCGQIGCPAICQDCQNERQAFPGPILYPSGTPLDQSWACFVYEGRAAQAVKRLKYERAMSLAEPMAEELAEAFERFDLEGFDLILPVPIHWTRRAVRGFNQAEILAEALPSEKVDLKLLKKLKRTKPQVSLTAAERRQSLQGAFGVVGELAGRSALLIDDVLTTGGTANACAQILKQAGAVRVEALTYCGESVREKPYSIPDAG